MFYPNVSVRAGLAVAMVILVLGTCPAGRAATITDLTDDFSAAPIDASKWSQLPSDFEVGTGTFIADTTFFPGQLRIAGTTTAQYWGGHVLQSVDTFASDKPAIISVDRVSLTGFGTAYRSSLWIKQTDGTYLHYAQNIGENGWQYNPNNTGSGTNIPSLDGLDGDGTQHAMKLVYTPQGGSSAKIDMYLDGNLESSYTFGSGWENNVDFNVRLSGMARANNDNSTSVFDNFTAKSLFLQTPNQTTQNTGTGFVVSGTDLLEGMVATVTGNVGAEEGRTTSDVSVLTNGQFGPFNAPVVPPANSEVVAIHNNTTLTYSLDTLAFPLGYEITDINTFAGWNDPGRDAQDYNVEIAFVDDPSLFFPLDSISYNPGGDPRPSDTAVFLSSPNSDPLARGVAAIRFVFASTENGYVGYREFDVLGQGFFQIPEPSTFVLSALGLLGLAFVGRRRKRE